MKHFTTCATKFIVYLITCPCKKQYVERTIRTFSVRVNEYLVKIKKGCVKHSIPRHYLEHHNRDPTGTQFQVIDKFIPHWRGDSCLRGVSQLDTYQIYELRYYSNLFIQCLSITFRVYIYIYCFYMWLFFIIFCSFPFSGQETFGTWLSDDWLWESSRSGFCQWWVELSLDSFCPVIAMMIRPPHTEICVPSVLFQ